MLYTYEEIAVHDIIEAGKAVGIDEERWKEMNVSETRIRSELSSPTRRRSSLTESARLTRKCRHYRPRIVQELVWMRQIWMDDVPQYLSVLRGIAWERTEIRLPWIDYASRNEYERHVQRDKKLKV